MITFLKKQSFWSLVALSFLFVSCNDDDEEDSTPPPSGPTQSIVEIASGNDDFTILVEALDAAGLVTVLSGDGPFTVFAPTNAAFNAFFDSQNVMDVNGDGSRVDDAVTALGADAVTATLLYHVLGAEVRAADVPELAYVTTASTASPGANQLSLLVESRSSGVFLNNGAQVTTADLLATNGVIHVINEVLTLPTVVDHAINNPGLLSELVNAVVAADLVGALSNPDATLTVFAPVNSGFDAISAILATLSAEQVSAALQYHVLASQERSTDLVSGDNYETLIGQTLTIAVGTNVEITDDNELSDGPSTVQVEDIQGTNGVVHVIDNVLIPAL